MDNEYVPFGQEWEQEMLKWVKPKLVELLKESLIKNEELEYKAEFECRDLKCPNRDQGQVEE